MEGGGVKLGGRMRIHEGLRHVAVGARGLDFDRALLPLATDFGSPQYVDPEAASEFVKFSRGLETYIQVGEVVNPLALGHDPAHRSYLQVCLQGFVRAACQLAAKALVIEPARFWAEPQQLTYPEGWSTLYATHTAEFFVGLDWEDYPLEILFRTGGDEAHANVLAQVCERMGPRAGIALSPSTVPGWEDRDVEFYLRQWGSHIRLALLREVTEERRGLIRALVDHCPVILEIDSLARQKAAATLVRTIAAEERII